MTEVLTRPRTLPKGKVRVLKPSELPLLRDHLLRLDPRSRRDRFNGAVDEDFIVRYAIGCLDDGVIVIGYFENGEVHAAAELHAPKRSADRTPEIAFSVEHHLRRRGVGSVLFKALLAEAKRAGYRRLRVTTGAYNEAMRALARKFGARLDFDHGEVSGVIDLAGTHLSKMDVPALKISRDLARAMIGFNQSFWNPLLQMWGVLPRSGVARSELAVHEIHGDPGLPDDQREAEQHQGDERKRRPAQQAEVLLERAHRHDQVQSDRRRQVADLQVQDHD
jgi:GNAT superfamily N-acetyltransferase